MDQLCITFGPLGRDALCELVWASRLAAAWGCRVRMELEGPGLIYQVEGPGEVVCELRKFLENLLEIS